MALRLLIVILILAVPLELPGCGPFLPQALFHMPRQPEAPADFARGQLGILQPTYDRVYQVVAYRYLAGVGLNGAEQQAVFPAPQPADSAPAPAAISNPWLLARNQVGGIQRLNGVDPNRVTQRPAYFNIYLNCNEDAFRTAAATLQRIRSTGHAAEWIAAQDTVFADCSKGADIPPPTADPQLRADRAYQIASAKFYSEQYDAARQDFQSIAADSSSPWSGVAPYLAARCLIRDGRFARAETELQEIAADPAMARWHAPANGLLGYVRTRLHPAQRMHELGLALVKPDSETTIGQDLIDYRVLFDQDIKPQSGDELTDWIRIFQAGGAPVASWREHRTLPWLVAALQAATPRDAAVPELLAAARAVKPDSPGYVTVNYRSVRLMPPDDARALADRLLAGDMPASARNQFRAERMRLARDFDDFLRYAPRRPVASSTYDVQPVDQKQDYLDADATDILNRDVPLALLKQAAAGNVLPDPIRQELRHAISVRELVFSKAPDFDQVFSLLKTPGLRPYLDAGYGRFTAELDKLDPYHDNWWCSPNALNVDYGNTRSFLSSDPTSQPFLEAADRDQAAAEWKKLQAMASAPDWLAAQALAFARAHPQDPRVPEALYLVVRATRFGCTDAHTGDFSHRAFDLLHQKYPTTEWAKKTPYWFN